MRTLQSRGCSLARLRPRRAQRGAGAGGGGAPSAEPEPAPGAACGYVVPRTFRTLVGKGHKDFSSGQQQDAGEFLVHLLSLYGRAHAAASASGIAARSSGALPMPLPSFFEFEMQQRILCTQTGGVAYKKVRIE